jgi:hypothetical protein
MEAMERFHVDPDRWEEITPKARNKMLAYASARATMEAWSAHVARGKGRRK